MLFKIAILIYIISAIIERNRLVNLLKHETAKVSELEVSLEDTQWELVKSHGYETGYNGIQGHYVIGYRINRDGTFTDLRWKLKDVIKDLQDESRSIYPTNNID